MAMACQMAKLRLTQYVQKQAGASSLVSRASTAFRAGFIATPITVAKGGVGNTAALTVKTLAKQPLQAGVDYLRSVGKAAIESTKQRKLISPMEYREVINGTNLQGFDAFVRGIDKGVQELRGAIQGGKGVYTQLGGSPFTQRIGAAIEEAKLRVVDANKTSTLLDYTPTQYKHPLMQAMTDMAFLLVEGIDRPFYYAAEEMSVTMQKRLAAIKAGARGKDIDIIASQLPTSDVIAAQASMDAHVATFKNRGLAAKTAEQIKHGFERASNSDNAGTAAIGSAALLGSNVAMPFTGVPTSIAMQGIEMTPLGALGLLANLKGVGLSGARNSEIVANTLLGIGGVAVGYAWAADGTITGKLTAAQRAEDPDRMEYALNTPSGSYSLQTLGPAAVPLFAGAALYEERKKDPSMSPSDVPGVVARSAIQQTANNTYMQGVKQLVDAAGDENKPIGSMMANIVPVPSLMTQAARAIDPQPRDARGIVDKLINKTPFSSTLPEATSSTGVTRPRTTAERVAALLSPIAYRENTPSPALDELQRLGVNIGKPAKVMQKNNVKVELSPAGMKEITETQGKLILPLVEKKLRDPEYLNWTDEKKQNYWEKVVAAQKARAKLTVRKQFNDTASGFFTGARR